MFNLIDIRLDLFDGGAGAAGSGGATGAGDGGNTSGANSNGASSGTSPVSARRSRSGEFDNVKFGKQPSAQDATTAQTAVSPAAGEDASTAEKSADTADKKTDPEARRKAYRELMDGEYKDLYQEEMQNIVKQRFKENKSLRETNEKQKVIMDILAEKYNVADGDVSKIQDALKKDKDFWYEIANALGIDDVEKCQEYITMKIETRSLREAENKRNEARKEAERQAQERRFVQDQMTKWETEGKALKEKYPNFDISADLQDKSFLGMLRVGVPMEVAYHAKHHSEIVTSAVNNAREQTEKNVVNNIRARGARPQENGTQSQSSFTVRDDVHNLSRAERAEIARRAARGEVIKF